MARISFIFFSAIFVICNGEIPYSRHAPRPHILFFMGDDIGWNDVGWNNKRIHTPFMNHLAKTGVILNKYYAFTLCTPSRASFMTGYYSDRLGLQRGVLMPTQPYGIPLKYKLISDRLKEVGYRSFTVGKWHLGYCDRRYTPNLRGFENLLGFYNGGEENYEHCLGYLQNRTDDGVCQGFDFRLDDELAHQFDNQWAGEVYANHIVNILEDYDDDDDDSPIFMYIAFTDPHFPLQPPEEFKNNCNNSVNKARRTFCGAMSAMDSEIELIVNKLREKGMYENSVIIFTSDNGGSTHFGGSNYPLRGVKGSIFEGGARVPAFVHSPLLRKRGYINNRLIHVSDWYPTILRLAGHRKVPDLDGVDQWQTICCNHRSPRTQLPYLLDIAVNGTLMAAVRDERYKLIAGSGGTSDEIVPENKTSDYSFNMTFMATYTDPSVIPFDLTDTTPKLYDLDNDPTESNDLASKMPEKVAELMGILKEMRSRSRPAMNIRNDSAGNPSNFDNAYTPGWCRAYYDTPIYAVEDTNQFIYPVM